MAGPVRHPIDIKALERYLEQNVPEIKTPIELKQFGFGQSNPTYQITTPVNGQKYVLRKKPPGKLLSAAAHKVEREARVLSALGPTDVTVPEVYCLCEDSTVIGTPFYIMSFLDGRIIEDAAMPEVSSPEERLALWKAAVETLAKLHRVDYKAIGLEKFGKSGGFYQRQIATWNGICSAQEKARDVDTGKEVGPLPKMEELMGFFSKKDRRPKDRTTIVHGDYKIDNLVFHKTEPRVIGILDWEMSTIGHPLSDLSNLTTQFFTCRRHASVQNAHAGFLPGRTPGLPSLDQIYSWYSAAAGWSHTAEELAWGMAFNVFRLAAVCQGIAARVARRQASSDEAKKHAETKGPLAEFAWDLAVESTEKKKKKKKKGGKAKL
ncbi:aminoglycoside phosphotransferase [Zalerion maritima]|uniref:Aminoglycoside phosphotransferase n=1 Tax=Zalerion maritima TaxID=339359 RepID=A0AAD5RVM5_9PEZI|nr:aminoglycoside phosphotransferase [Zalerion maritima]